MMARCLTFRFLFRVVIKYLFRSNGVNIQLQVENTGTADFPFSLGWHPYFHLEQKEGNLLQFDSLKKVLVDDRCVPTELMDFKTPQPLDIEKDRIDDCYELNVPVCVITTQDYKLKLSSSKESSYLQIYHPPGSNRVAVEPLTGIANCLNNGIGLRILEIDKCFSQVWKIEIS